jgi:hypothetical protein
VQAADAPGRRERKPGDRRAAVGAEDQLRRLDLHLEPEASVGQVVRALEGCRDIRHHRDLRDRRDLGQCECEAVGQAAVLEEGAHEEIEGADASRPRRRLERLEADADERRGETRTGCGGHPLGGALGVGVLDVVAMVAVAVFEVDPQILDRFAFELLEHPRSDGGGDVGIDSHRDGERLDAPGPIDGGECGTPPHGGQLWCVSVGGHVHGVHGLARSVVAGIRGGEQLVGRGEAGVDRGEIGFGEYGAHPHSSSS